MADDELAERIMDLEVKAAYQERAVIDLDEVVRELARRVTALEAELARLRDGAPAAPSPAAPTSDPPAS